MSCAATDDACQYQSFSLLSPECAICVDSFSYIDDMLINCFGGAAVLHTTPQFAEHCASVAAVEGGRLYRLHVSAFCRGLPVTFWLNLLCGP